jgi:hypothetical protein
LEVDNSIVQSLLNLFEPIKAALENKVSDVSAEGNKNLSGYSMDDKIGSHHWFNTLMAGILHIGEYMKLHDTIDSELQKDWGNKLYNTAKDMIEWFKEYASIVNERKDKRYDQLEQNSKILEYSYNACLEKLAERKDNVGVSDAIEFAEWILKNNMCPDGFGGWGGGRINVNYYGSKTADLYKHFQESQPQQKEVDEEKELEERTDRNMNVISDFCEHLKNENIVIPESVILSFFNA